MPNVKKARKDCQYTAEERKVLHKFKEEYRSQVTSDARGHVFRSKILPAIFNYWSNDGLVAIPDDKVGEQVKV
jgi:hypothetical protein